MQASLARHQSGGGLGSKITQQALDALTTTRLLEILKGV